MATIRKRRDKYEVQAAVPTSAHLKDFPRSQVRSGLDSADGGRSTGSNSWPPGIAMASNLGPASRAMRSGMQGRLV
jgi:hypothetical protein